MTALPRSLQAMIEDARNAQARPSTSVAAEENDEACQAVEEFIDELCRGEYTQTLYWECVATDRLEDGDWEGAEAVYHEILALDLDSDSMLDRCKAFGDLAALHKWLGQDDLALQNFHAATCEAKKDDIDIIYRVSLLQESWQLVRMARFRPALILAREGLSTVTEDDNDHLSVAGLLTVVAMCYLALGRSRKVRKRLQEAWQHLEALRAHCEATGMLEMASGIHTVYYAWWRVEALYLRTMGDDVGELRALEQSLKKARDISTSWQEECPLSHARVMCALLANAEALQRAGRAEETSDLLAEADDIFQRRKLPESARCASLVPSQPIVKRPSLFWRLFGG